MKKLIILSAFMLFLFSNIGLAAGPMMDNGFQYPNSYHKQPTKTKQPKLDPQFYDKDGVKKYDGWAYYHGWSEKPPRIHYDRNYAYLNPGYKYRGHWNTWRDWDRYKMKNPYVFDHGRYEKYNDHFFFIFNDGFYRFVFSIGN